jgi:hypothetical protein
MATDRAESDACGTSDRHFLSRSPTRRRSFQPIPMSRAASTPACNSSLCATAPLGPGPKPLAASSAATRIRNTAAVRGSRLLSGAPRRCLQELRCSVARGRCDGRHDTRNCRATAAPLNRSARATRHSGHAASWAGPVRRQATSTRTRGVWSTVVLCRSPGNPGRRLRMSGVVRAC